MARRQVKVSQALSLLEAAGDTLASPVSGAAAYSGLVLSQSQLLLFLASHGFSLMSLYSPLFGIHSVQV